MHSISCINNQQIYVSVQHALGFLVVSNVHTLNVEGSAEKTQMHKHWTSRVWSGEIIYSVITPLVAFLVFYVYIVQSPNKFDKKIQHWNINESRFCPLYSKAVIYKTPFAFTSLTCSLLVS